MKMNKIFLVDVFNKMLLLFTFINNYDVFIRMISNVYVVYI